ncbi:hypothetical protein OIU34_24605 [Pararhizobium sp. BT-229]|uniref:hypothetical protein n=1 Tax=Pararhizobium sp. BT-229 TaxID=2986923 RepID=UPI0021F7323B|nr:hypothetical protein [Pararhizobium sp. BT-229]MCV9965083.1 hypothetical protein [Pararhizobium sp. BT-229]
MTFPADLIEEFTFGKCYALAAALHEETGWPIGALVADWKATPGSATVRRRVVHAFVRAPDGSVLDARGHSEERDLGKTFFGPERVIVKSWVEDFDDLEAFRNCLVSTEIHVVPEYRLRQEIDDFFARTMPSARAACAALNLVATARNRVCRPVTPSFAVC